MTDLVWYQFLLIGLCFVWGGFVRSGLGFGGSVLTLPFLLLILDQPLVFLPIIGAHLLFFSALTVYRGWDKSIGTSGEVKQGTVNREFVWYAFKIMIIPKIIGVFGLITLPGALMSGVIFSIITIYSISYISNRPFRSAGKTGETLLLMLGGYVSGTSLIAAPLVVSVFANHVSRHQLRDSLLALWFILVTIKMAAFIVAGVDLQLMHHLWLLPCAAAGHVLGLKFHDRMLHRDPAQFYRLLGVVLLVTSVMGLWRMASPS